MDNDNKLFNLRRLKINTQLIIIKDKYSLSCMIFKVGSYNNYGNAQSKWSVILYIYICVKVISDSLTFKVFIRYITRFLSDDN